MGGCESCEDNGINCTACKDGLNLEGKKCVSTCKKGTFALNKICEPCDPKCSACTGPSDQECSECAFHSGQ